MLDVKENDLLEGVVTRILPYGAMMVFEDETMGLLHISEITDNYIRNIYRYLHVGVIYLVKVISVDKEKNFLKVSLKRISKEEREASRKLLKENVTKYSDFSKLKENLPSWIEKELNKLKIKEENK